VAASGGSGTGEGPGCVFRDVVITLGGTVIASKLCEAGDGEDILGG
jgi:hypothetical protein